MEKTFFMSAEETKEMRKHWIETLTKNPKVRYMGGYQADREVYDAVRRELGLPPDTRE